MQREFAIRDARPEDAAVLVEFNRAMARETESKELQIETVSAGVAGLLANPRHGFYVIVECAPEVVGALMVTSEWSDWRNGLFWWIQSVYVQPLYRRQGVYRSLYAYVKPQSGRSRERPRLPIVCGEREPGSTKSLPGSGNARDSLYSF